MYESRKFIIYDMFTSGCYSWYTSHCKCFTLMLGSRFGVEEPLFFWFCHWILGWLSLPHYTAMFLVLLITSCSTCHLLYSGLCSGGGLLAFSDARPFHGAYADAIPVDHKKKRVVVLGTGWAGTSFLKNLKDPSYEVQVVSPRNYFAFTPLLPSVTCGTVEARSIVEPVRNIVKKVHMHCWTVYISWIYPRYQ